MQNKNMLIARIKSNQIKRMNEANKQKDMYGEDFGFYDREEKKILEERPYNWKKHFLFTLPEQFWFLTRVLALLVGGYFFLGVVMDFSFKTVVEQMPLYCEQYFSNETKR